MGTFLSHLKPRAADGGRLTLATTQRKAQFRIFEDFARGEVSGTGTRRA
jgi:hypothetical protein